MLIVIMSLYSINSLGKSKKNRVNVVYSTNPNFEFEVHSNDEMSIPFNQQKLYVSIDRKNRGGKSRTIN